MNEKQGHLLDHSLKALIWTWSGHSTRNWEHIYYYICSVWSTSNAASVWKWSSYLGL